MAKKRTLVVLMLIGGLIALMIGVITQASQQYLVTQTVLAATNAQATLQREQYREQYSTAMAYGTVTPLASATYECYIDAYSQEGARALLQPLPSEEGIYGERVYSILLPTEGRRIPMHVYGDGSISYAPGESLGKTLEDMGIVGPLHFTDLTYGKLEKIHLWVFNDGTNLTSNEAVRLAESFPVHYSVEQNGAILEVPMFALMRNGAIDKETFLQNYQAFEDLQRQHAAEIYESMLQSLQKGRDEAALVGGMCGDFAASKWQLRIDQVKSMYRESGEVPFAYQGNGRRLLSPDAQSGEWEMLIFVHLTDQGYSGADPLFMTSGERLFYFDLATGKPVYYSYTRVGELPTLFHELSHMVIGEDETHTDRAALALLTHELNKWQAGIFEAIFVVIDNETGQALPPQP